MKILATYNIKGKAGKTATMVNISHLAARDGMRVLLWDLDPQEAASVLLRVKPRVKGAVPRSSRAAGTSTPRSRALTSTGPISCRPDFAYRNLDLVLDATKKPTQRLDRLLRPLAAEYDLSVLDCPPSISLLSESVLHAADILLVPLIATTLSVRTLGQLSEFISGFDGRRPRVLRSAP